MASVDEWEVVLVAEVDEWFVDLVVNDPASAALIERAIDLLALEWSIPTWIARPYART